MRKRAAYPQMPQRRQASSAAGAWAVPPFAVSLRLAGSARPTLSMICAISSKGTRLAIPESASCAEENAAATPMALRFWQGTSTRPPTGSQTRPSRLDRAMEANHVLSVDVTLRPAGGAARSAGAGTAEVTRAELVEM